MFWFHVCSSRVSASLPSHVLCHIKCRSGPKTNPTIYERHIICATLLWPVNCRFCHVHRGCFDQSVMKEGCMTMHVHGAFGVHAGTNAGCVLPLLGFHAFTYVFSKSPQSRAPLSDPLYSVNMHCQLVVQSESAAQQDTNCSRPGIFCDQTKTQASQNQNRFFCLDKWENSSETHSWWNLPYSSVGTPCVLHAVDLFFLAGFHAASNTFDLDRRTKSHYSCDIPASGRL